MRIIKPGTIIYITAANLLHLEGWGFHIDPGETVPQQIAMGQEQLRLVLVHIGKQYGIDLTGHEPLSPEAQEEAKALMASLMSRPTP